MSLRHFPRFAPTSYHWGPSFSRQNDLSPLFSLMDDLTNGEVSRRQGGSKQDQERFFAPRFDLKEVKDQYVLEGELPGIDQKDISIEFTDDHSLVVSGSTEKSYESGTKPKQIESGSKRATVEDDTADKGKQSGQVVEQGQQGGQAESGDTYWVSERISGSFTRSFSFPQRVNQDAVKASLKNGILNITVPKAAAPETKRISIE